MACMWTARRVAGSEQRLRTDVSCTLFLCEPEDYEGGERVCAFFWAHSTVRDDARRSMLFGLDQAITGLRGKFGETEESVSLAGHYHNLLRMWAET